MTLTNSLDFYETTLNNILNLKFLLSQNLWMKSQLKTTITNFRF